MKVLIVSLLVIVIFLIAGHFIMTAIISSQPANTSEATKIAFTLVDLRKVWDIVLGILLGLDIAVTILLAFRKSSNSENN